MSTEYAVKIKSQSADILPKGWLKVPFEYMAENISVHIEPDETDLDVYVGLEHLDSDSLRIKRWGTPDDVIGIKLHVWPGDIIFGKRRAYQRKVAVADFEAICSAHSMVLRARPENIEQEFLPFFMQSEEFAQRAVAISEGSLSPTIKWKNLAQQEFIIPPKDEQRRIADILWAAEECIVKNEVLTDKIQLYKKIMMIKLLTKGIRHKQFKDNEIGRIPEEWKVVKLEEILDELKNGFASGKRDENGIVQIRMNNVTTNGHLIFDSYLKVPIPENINFWLLKKGDFLFNNTNSIDLVGKSTIFNDALFPCTFSNHFTRIRFKKDLVLPELALYHFLSLWEKGYFKSVAIRHVNQSAVRTEYLLKLKIPLPPLIEQHQIVDILSKIGNTIKEVQENINKTKELKKMLINKFLNCGLGKAFSINLQANQLYETQVSE